MEVKKLNLENIEEIRNLYNSFLQVSKDDFLFEVPPLNFDYFKENFTQGYLKGYYTQNGFLLYSDMLNQAIEITLIYTKETTEDYAVKKSLLAQFLEDIKSIYPHTNIFPSSQPSPQGEGVSSQNKVISYPMLGVQNDFTQDITNFGFKPIGEMIVELDFNDILTKTLYDKFIPEHYLKNYKTEPWSNTYLDEVTNIIHNEFSQLNDAKFDPRFKTFEGTKSIIEEITNGYYGDFDPKYTTILTLNGQICGCCLVNFTTPDTANIPLVALDAKHKKQGLGLIILKNSVKNLKIDIDNKAKVINATCDTDNFPAVHMYRKAGFKEKTYYTHAYLEV